MLLAYFLDHRRYWNIVGIVLVLLLAIIFSRKRSHINYRLIFYALLLEFFIAFSMLRTTVGHTLLGGVADGIATLYQAADAGAQFLFGNLANAGMPWGFIFALKVLPIIIFFGAFYHFWIR